MQMFTTYVYVKLFHFSTKNVISFAITDDENIAIDDLLLSGID